MTTTRPRRSLLEERGSWWWRRPAELECCGVVGDGIPRAGGRAGDWEEVRRRAMGTDAAAGDGEAGGGDPACGRRRAAGIPRAGGGGDGIPRAGEDFFVGPTETSPN
jgi:hypothetical protein